MGQWLSRRGEGPGVAAPRRSVSLGRLEVVLVEIVGDLFAEHGSLRVGGAEVDAGPHSGVDDLLVRVREPVEAPRGTGFVAEGAEGDLVGAEEALQRVHERTGRAAVARGGWSGKGGVTSGGPLKTGVVGWNSGGHHVGSATVAAIGCWNDKYYWQFWRPITAIREADTDGNPGAG